MQGSEGETINIQACLDRLRAGESEARDELFARAYNRLHRLAHKMLKGFPRVRRWEETGDVAHDAMGRLERSLSAETPSSVLHFFRLSALQIRRELIDLSRQHYGPEGMGARHHSGRQPGGDSVPAPYEPDASTDGPATLAKWTEFHEAIERLPDEEREIVDLHFYGGLMLKDVAEALGVSERTAKRRWRSARLMLRESLHGALPGDR